MLENITMIFSSYILNVISSFPFGMHASKARINSLMEANKLLHHSGQVPTRILSIQLSLDMQVMADIQTFISVWVLQTKPVN